MRQAICAYVNPNYPHQGRTIRVAFVPPTPPPFNPSPAMQIFWKPLRWRSRTITGSHSMPIPTGTCAGRRRGSSTLLPRQWGESMILKAFRFHRLTSNISSISLIAKRQPFYQGVGELAEIFAPDQPLPRNIPKALRRVVYT